MPTAALVSYFSPRELSSFYSNLKHTHACFYARLASKASVHNKPVLAGQFYCLSIVVPSLYPLFYTVSENATCERSKFEALCAQAQTNTMAYANYNNCRLASNGS